MKKKTLFILLIVLLLGICAASFATEAKPEAESTADAEETEISQDAATITTASKTESGMETSSMEETGNKQKKTDTGAAEEIVSQNGSTAAPEKKGHYETRTVLVKEAWDEQVLVKKGSCENVLISEAWDEETGACYAYGREYVMGYECGICSYQTTGDISAHISSEHDGAGNWHNVKIYTSDEKCLDYRTETIHHDAAYETRCEPDEYETVHHDAVYRTETVWIEE